MRDSQLLQLVHVSDSFRTYDSIFITQSTGWAEWAKSRILGPIEKWWFLSMECRVMNPMVHFRVFVPTLQTKKDSSTYTCLWKLVRSWHESQMKHWKFKNSFAPFYHSGGHRASIRCLIGISSGRNRWYIQTFIALLYIEIWVGEC